MFWILALLIAGFVMYRYRVQILSRVLGQPESRIQRQLTRKKQSRS